MNDAVMTYSQAATLQRIARDMGLQLDELLHPYREVKMIGEDGEQCWRIVDFDPYTDPADAFRVQVHFNLSLESDRDSFIVREADGPLLAIHFIEEKTIEGRVRAACMAICEGAARWLTNNDKRAAANSQRDLD